MNRYMNIYISILYTPSHFQNILTYSEFFTDIFSFQFFRFLFYKRQMKNIIDLVTIFFYKH